MGVTCGCHEVEGIRKYFGILDVFGLYFKRDIKSNKEKLFQFYVDKKARE